MNQLLTLREDPEIQNREITARTLNLRAASADDKTRSVEVIMATDAPVTVWDSERGIIDEVLVADGGSFPESMPLLRDHARYSIDCVLGSVKGARRDGSAWKGRAYFAEGDEDVDRAWNKVRQGHLTDVSIGYRTTDYEDIPPQTTRTVNGREYTAGNRWLRISRRWEAKELSLVPIGADRNAKVREDGPVNRKEHQVNPELLKFLKSIGLRSDATEDQAKAFLAALGGASKTRADAIAAGTMTFEQAAQRSEGDTTEEDEEEAEREGMEEDEEEDEEEEGARKGKRSTKSSKRSKSGQRSDPSIVQSAIQAERQRAAAIRALGGQDVPSDLVARAIDEGWSKGRASSEFLKAIRGNRSDSVGTAPAGIVHNHDRDCTRHTLGIAMAMRAGVTIDEKFAKRNKIADWANVAQRADRYNDMSMIDVAREAIRLDGREVPHTRDETIRAAVSGGTFSQIFTTSVNARLTQGFDEEVDTTQGWVEETDEADFKTNTAIKYYGQTALQKLGPGGTAKDAAPSDAGEDYKVARYAKKFTVDEQDIINDSFSALMTQPYEFGVAARRLRPDLVYSILLANPTLSETSGALFNSTAITTTGGHANLTTGALAASTLQTAITMMLKQYLYKDKVKVPLNIKPMFLIVPSDLYFTAEILLSSAERIVASNDNGTFNPLRNMLQLRADSRISTVGVTDPDTGTAYAGTATNYFLASRPGRTLRVAYRRGTGRGPVLRNYILDKGQWGLGWDINMDIGAKAIDFRGLVKSTGA